jgi:hypothetical protein
VWKVATQRSRNHIVKASQLNLAVTNGLVGVAILFILVHACTAPWLRLRSQ